MAYDEFLMPPSLEGKRLQSVGATITSRGRSERVVVLLSMLNITNGDWPTALHDSGTKQAFVVAVVSEELKAGRDGASAFSPATVPN